MFLNYLKIFIILYLLPSILNGQATSTWPENINNLKTGICLVEYFQPQFEMGEIEDKSRIKRKITGILVNNRNRKSQPVKRKKEKHTLFKNPFNVTHNINPTIRALKKTRALTPPKNLCKRKMTVWKSQL